MYLNEHKVTKLSDAALMADEFVLTHVSASYLNKSKLGVSERNKRVVVHQNVKPSVDNSSVTRIKSEIVCFYCRKPGHRISDCIALKKKEKSVKPIGLISRVNSSSAQFSKQIKCTDIIEMENVKDSVDFGPFLTDGSVSLPL